jgi:hypothetical protein
MSINKNMFTEVTDNEGHHYIIPFKNLDEWYEWLDQEDNDDVPEYAERFEGQTLVFPSWELV